MTKGVELEELITSFIERLSDNDYSEVITYFEGMNMDQFLNSCRFGEVKPPLVTTENKKRRETK